jgi:hypothetical protein
MCVCESNVRTEKKQVHTGLWWGDLRETDHVEDTGLKGMILLKWIFKRWEHASMNAAYQTLNLTGTYCYIKKVVT